MIRIGYVIDTWVWVEYYYGEISRVREYVENSDNDLFTSVITLTEMKKFLYQREECPAVVENIVREIGVRSLIVPVSETIAILAGELKKDGFKGGIADTLILAMAREGNHTIITGDPHFRNLPDVVFIEQS
ncbi:MAG: PIN domain-containing protein [Methanoregula sp.]|jgi:predicted nucleic acid-binding protein|nr:PIN domain-containing protein [Methanoregula sp.]